MSITTLMISCIERQYTQEYIANVFWRQDIAKVSNITLIPYIKNTDIYSIAYINIAEWCASEAAYNFIHRLKNPTKEARIVHHEENWWPVEINTHNNGEIQVGSYTVSFDSNYWVKDKLETQDSSDNKRVSLTEDEEAYPIKGFYGEYYTVEEALERMIILNDQLSDVWKEIKTHRDPYFIGIKDEMIHLENELRIQEALNKSSNVTHREPKFGNKQMEPHYVSHQKHNCPLECYV